MKNPSRKSLLAISQAVAVALCAATFTPNAKAQTSWQVVAGNWAVGGNWDNGVPDAADQAMIDNGGIATVTTVGNVALRTFLGTDPGDIGNLLVTDGSTLDSGDGMVVGFYGTGKLTINGGALVIATYGEIGAVSGSTGIATVSGVTSLWTTLGELRVGGTGTLNIQNGGAVSNSSAYIANSSGSTGTVTVDGAGSTWTNSGDLYVGYKSIGTLNILNGGAVTDSVGIIGAFATSNGAVIVNGVGSTWTSSTYINIGNSGIGTLNIQNGGAVSNTFGHIGYNPGSTGTATVDGVGSTWTNTGDLYVGELGNGTLNIQNGGLVSNTEGHIGFDVGSVGTVILDGAGSTWTNTGELVIGYAGTGTLNILDGGLVSNSDGYIGSSASGIGTVTLDGVGSTWTNSNLLYVGYSGTGVMSVGNGGQVSNTSAYVGGLAGSTGTVTVDGAGSIWTNNSTLYVGYRGTGTLNIQNGGQVSGADVYLSTFADSTGIVTVDGVGSTWTNSGNLHVGFTGTGVLNIQNGGQISNTDAFVGRSGGSMGTVTVDGAGSTWTNSGGLEVGYTGTGVLNVQNGGQVSSSGGIIGRSSVGTGTATVNGASSIWTNSSSLNVGDSGTGTLNILNGGQVSNTNAVIGLSTGSIGSVTVDGAGSNWTNSDILYVADSGTGTLNILNGGQVSNTDGLIGFFAGSTGTVTVDGAGSTWTNNGSLYVGGGINASGGTGLLSITNGGTVSAAETTIYSTGTVVVDGTLNSAQVFNYGVLDGSGTITGNLVNGALLSPGNSPGIFTVLGNYTQTANSSLQIEIASKTSFDLLRVGGVASLNGNLQIITLGGFVPATTDKFTILTAAVGVNGKFSSVDQSLSTALFDVTYLSNSVRLEFLATQFDEFFEEIGSFIDFALTPNQKAVARAIDRSSDDSRQSDLVDYLLARDIDLLPRDFDRIAPEELTALFEITRANSEIHLQNIGDQLALARSGVRGFTSSLSVSDNDGKRVLDPKDGKAMPKVFAPTKDNNWGVWVSGTGEYVNVGDSNHVNGFDFQTGGITLGLDYRVCSSFILGVATSYAHTNTDLIESGDIDVEAGRLALYGTWFNGGAYVNGIVGGGYSSYDTHRRGLDSFVNGDTDGANFDASIAGGYDFKTGSLTFGPTASLAYTYTDIDGFRENGSLAPLQIEGQNDDSLRSRVGGHLQAEFKAGSVTIRPEIRAEWQHEFQDDTRSITAGFANGAGNNFTVTGPEIGRDSAILGAGVSVDWSKTITTYANYEAEIGRANYERQNVNLGLRLSF